MKDYDPITRALEALPNNLEPKERLEKVLHIALSSYPSLKESFFSEDVREKESALKVIRWLLDRVEDEIELASQKEKMSGNQLLAVLYGSENLSAEECKQFMQARALVMEHASEIFAKKKTKRRLPPIKI